MILAWHWCLTAWAWVRIHWTYCEHLLISSVPTKLWAPIQCSIWCSRRHCKGPSFLILDKSWSILFEELVLGTLWQISCLTWCFPRYYDKSNMEQHDLLVKFKRIRKRDFFSWEETDEDISLFHVTWADDLALVVEIPYNVDVSPRCIHPFSSLGQIWDEDCGRRQQDCDYTGPAWARGCACKTTNVFPNESHLSCCPWWKYRLCTTCDTIQAFNPQGSLNHEIRTRCAKARAAFAIGSYLSKLDFSYFAQSFCQSWRGGLDHGPPWPKESTRLSLPQFGGCTPF